LSVFKIELLQKKAKIFPADEISSVGFFYPLEIFFWVAGPSPFGALVCVG
jgi:hypothetical protein